MTDKKITQLTAATTPLAGTEVLPIVQGTPATTVKVSVANLTAGRAISATGATLTGLTASSAVATDASKNLVSVTNTGTGNNVLAASPAFTGTPTFTNAAATQATLSGWSWTNGANSSSGSLALGGIAAYRGQIGFAADGNTLLSIDSTYDSANAKMQFRLRTAGTPVTALSMLGSGNVTVDTGNLAIGTAAKGINFTANTPAAGMTSQLLNWYEEGTWTPNQGAGLTLVGAFSSAGTYTRIGRQVFIRGSVSGATSVAVASAGAIATNLPYSSAADSTGAAINAANDASSVLRVSSATLTAATAIAATATITFSAVYSV